MTDNPTTNLTAQDNSDDELGTVDIAKGQAVSVGQGAADAGQHVAGVAQDQAQSVVAEAGSQAKDLLDQTRAEVSEQVSAQQQRLAVGLRALGDELHSMSQHPQESGVATDLVRQGASKAHDVASWLEDREPGHLVQELQHFARRRPAAFLLAAAGAGLLAGRLIRGVKDASSGDSEASSTSISVSPPEHRPLPGGPEQLGSVAESSGPGWDGGADL